MNQLDRTQLNPFRAFKFGTWMELAEQGQEISAEMIENDLI